MNKKNDVKFVPKAIDGGLERCFSGIEEECLSHDSLARSV